MPVLAQTGSPELQVKVAQLGAASLQTSQLALTKASNPQVKMFAKFDAAEQETMGKILVTSLALTTIIEHTQKAQMLVSQLS